MSSAGNPLASARALAARWRLDRLSDAQASRLDEIVQNAPDAAAFPRVTAKSIAPLWRAPGTDPESPLTEPGKETRP